MGNFADIIILLSNYSHDIATAFLFTGGVTMWILARECPTPSDPDGERYFIRIYRQVVRVGGVSLVWILIAGVPRVVNYQRFEWADAAGNLQVIAVAVKHVIIFLIVGTGLYYWHRMHRKVTLLRKKHHM